MLSPGAVVDGKYLVEALLGIGGMAEVWSVVHQRLGARRALKVLRFGDAALGHRLLVEGQIQAGLEHPNLLPVLDVVDVEGSPGLVLPLADGASLEAALLVARPQPEEAASLLLALLAGLRHAHRAGVAHRDLKPANVLLAWGQEGLVPRIADFGVAVAVAGGGITAGGVSLGTPGYAAPEQLAGRSPTGFAADWWSFGALAHELIAGRRPGLRGAGGPDATMPNLDWHALLVDLLHPDPVSRLQDPELIEARLRLLGAEAGPLRGPWARKLQEGALDTGPIPADARAQNPTPGVRYVVQPGADPRRAAALDRATGRTVTLLPITPRETALVVTWAPLLHPNLVAIRDLVRHPTPRLVVENLEATESLEAALGESPTAVKVEAIAALLGAVGHLHAAGGSPALLPSHVGVAGGEVRLLPFGAGLHDVDGDPLVAPELAAGAPASEASNVYAVGLLAHTLLVGRPAFVGRTAAARLHAQLTAPLDLDGVRLDRALLAFLRGSLAGTAEQRFRSCAEALAALRTSPAAPAESRAGAAEAELQGGAVLGREVELAAVLAALQTVTTSGSAALLLVGESGVGKSRLLDAARGHAWAAGARVLRGRAEPESGLPYAALVEGVRVLARETALTGEERAALSALLPGGAPPGRAVGRTAATDRAAGALRSVLGRLGAPVVWQLDDLQWVGDDVAALLSELLATPVPGLLLLGTWREEGSGPRPVALSGFVEVPVARLAEPVTRALCRRVLGEAAATQIGERLHGETGGNALFLVESLRELRRVPFAPGSEPEVGQLRSAAVAELLEARVARVPMGHRERLELAAVFGRKLDLPLLAATTGADGLHDWVEELERRAILQRFDGELRFVHHKLREVLLAALPPERVRERAGRLAAALAASGRPDIAAELAHLWQEAGRPEEEAACRPLAGEQALARGADADAVRHLERALSLTRPDAPALAVARLHRLLGEALYARGHFTEASGQLERALTKLGQELPPTDGAWARRCLAAFAEQVWHRFFPPPPPDEAAAASLREVARAWGRWNNIWMFRGRALEYLTVALMSLNAADRAGEVSPGGAGALALAGSVLGLPRQAAYYADRAEVWCRANGAWAELADLKIHLASVHLGRADLATAEQIIAEARELALRSGSSQRLALTHGVKGLCDAFRGDFAGALRGAEASLATWRSAQGVGMRVGHLVARSLTLERLGRAAETLPELEAHRDYEPAYDRMSRGFVLSHTSLLLARVGRFEEAADTAVAATRYADERGLEPPGMSPYLVAHPAEALLRCVAAARRSGRGDEAALLRLARTHAARMRRFGRKHPNGRSDAAWVEGTRARLEGNEARAVEAWRAGAAFAASVGHRFTELRLELMLSGSPAVPAAERAKLRERAVAGLEACGAGAVVTDYDEWRA